MSTTYPEIFSSIFTLDKSKSNVKHYEKFIEHEDFPYKQIRLEQETYYNGIYLRVKNHSAWAKCLKISLSPTKYSNFYYGKLLINEVTSFFVCRIFDDFIQFHLAPLFCPYSNYDRENLIEKLVKYYD